MTKWKFIAGVLFFLGLIVIPACHVSEQHYPPPNVIFFMTDDQGIGDLGCHGNPWLKTPNLDRFYNEAVRLTDFHVSPLCTPTRSAIITGRYPINNGAWATFKGRATIHHTEPTIAEIFQGSGYATGMFGKWHLGDNYPSRPADCGFDHAVHHRSGGVGELSDYWGNNYFNDVYLVNNEPVQFSGYCTDVWFEEAMKFIARYKEEPFFVYLATNAAHVPHYVPEKYAEPYRVLEGTEIPNAAFYGMLANIDENFGRLDSFLRVNDLAGNTILIFCTDNGTQSGYSSARNLGWNMGLRGTKGAKEEGGHRVPFFIRWPVKGITGGRDIDQLLSHVDVLPTLAGLCGFSPPRDMNLDGIDCSALLLQKEYEHDNRTVFIHHRQDWRPPHDVKGTCILKNGWRLIDGTRLYDIKQDTGQQFNIIHEHPDVAELLLAENSAFVSIARQRREYQDFPVSVIGSSEQRMVCLTIQHAIGDDRPVWRQEDIALGIKNTNSKHAISIAEKGHYRFSLTRWPAECPGPVKGIPPGNPKNLFSYKTLSPELARLEISGMVLQKKIDPGSDAVVFEMDLEPGPAMLEASFIERDQEYGVYYVYAERRERDGTEGNVLTGTHGMKRLKPNKEIYNVE